MASETYDRIQEAIKVAMKSGDATTRDVLRMVVSDVKNRTVNEGKEITEEAVVSCLKKFVKQIEDSIGSAREAGRDDLVARSEREREIVSRFLPRTLSEGDQEALCRQLVEKFAQKTGAAPSKKDFGMIMKSIPANCDKGFCSKVLRGLIG